MLFRIVDVDTSLYSAILIFALFDVPSLDLQQRQRAATAVFEALNAKLSGSEAEQVRHALPAEVRDLWEDPSKD